MIDFLSGNVVIAALVAVTVYTAYGVVYRLYLSPIAKFPGPKLAALTSWQVAFKNPKLFEHSAKPATGMNITTMYIPTKANSKFPISQEHQPKPTSQSTMMLAVMHEKYGPIMRINPVQLHIATPEFYDTLYSSTLKNNKCGYTYAAFSGLPGGMFQTLDHNLHRARRAGVSQYFSVKNVRRLQPVVEAKMEIFLQRLREMAVTGKVRRLVPMTSAFSSGELSEYFYESHLTGIDVIATYCFGQSLNRLQHPTFDEEGSDESHDFAKMTRFLMHFPWLFKVTNAIPESILLRFEGGMATLVRLQQVRFPLDIMTS